MFIAKDWEDYECLDTGNGEKLERWGTVTLRRPDPQAIWPIRDERLWDRADARYQRSASGGSWVFRKPLPDRWQIRYRSLAFHVRPASQKQTGLFPEQAVNWAWIMEKIAAAGKPVNVLNLFAYTGGATLAAAAAGGRVCHVDAAKGAVQWAKENAELSGLQNRPIRYIADDVFKFVQREIRRGNRYDAVIMDPPSFGRGPSGERWELETGLFSLVEACQSILSDEPVFFLINAYTTGLAPAVLANLLDLTVKTRYGGIVRADNVGLPVSGSGLVLPAGVSGRWEGSR